MSNGTSRKREGGYKRLPWRSSQLLNQVVYQRVFLQISQLMLEFALHSAEDDFEKLVLCPSNEKKTSMPALFQPLLSRDMEGWTVEQETEHNNKKEALKKQKARLWEAKTGYVDDKWREFAPSQGVSEAVTTSRVADSIFISPSTTSDLIYVCVTHCFLPSALHLGHGPGSLQPPVRHPHTSSEKYESPFPGCRVSSINP